MAETWLQANRRVVALPIGVAVLAFAGCGIGLVLSSRDAAAINSPTYIALFVAEAVLGLVLFGLIMIARTPRIAYEAGRVKFYVRFGPPVDVPVESVEAFLLGRGPIFFTDDRRETKETTTIICRIAERATDYHNVQTAPLLAAWCGNNATIRGTWTEPLGIELVNRLNQRLYDVKQARAAAEATGAGA